MTRSRANPFGGPQRITLPGGQTLLAGLTWEMAEGPDLPVLTDTRLRLRHGNRIARVAPGDGAQTDGALLLALVADALRQRTPAQTAPETWLFVAVIGPDANTAPSVGTGPLIWTGLAELGPAGGGELTASPHPRSETLNGDPDTALKALKEDLAVTPVAGIAMSVIGGTGGTEASASISPAALGREITALCAQAAPEATFLHVGPELAFRSLPGASPCFAAPARLPLRKAGILGAAITASVVFGLTLTPWIAKALRAPVPAPPELVRVAPGPMAFGEVCTAALADWWPRIVGWQRGDAGCALAGHIPAGYGPVAPGADSPRTVPILIWLNLKRTKSANPVLAKGAAARVLEGWPHGQRITPGTILLWQTRALPLVATAIPASAPVTNSTPAAGSGAAVSAAARLAALWADTPDAVTADGTGFIVTASSGPQELFARAARVPGLTPVRLERPAKGRTTLVLRPPASRVLPRALFSTDIAFAPDHGGSK